MTRRKKEEKKRREVKISRKKEERKKKEKGKEKRRKNFYSCRVKIYMPRTTKFFVRTMSTTSIFANIPLLFLR